jgi:hypothetical protein
MIGACDGQVAELKDMRSTPSPESSNPLQSKPSPWIVFGVWHLKLPKRSPPFVQETV